MINSVFGQCIVSDLARAEAWYSEVFDSQPDLRPMAGLIQWQLDGGNGLQVWSDPDRAGNSGVFLNETDLDAAAQRLTTSGIDHDGPEPGGGVRILKLIDPDGNEVVLAGQ